MTDITAYLIVTSLVNDFFLNSVQNFITKCTIKKCGFLHTCDRLPNEQKEYGEMFRELCNMYISVSTEINQIPFLNMILHSYQNQYKYSIYSKLNSTTND
jgi:hypothetical protein